MTMPANSAPRPAKAAQSPKIGGDLPVRVAAGVAGGVFLGLWRPRDKRSVVWGAAGVLLAGFAVRRAIEQALIAAGLDRKCVSARLTLDVARPVHDVFTFFRDFENFPLIIGELHSITDFQDGRSHWEVTDGRGGVVAFDTVVSKYLPNSVIAWQSVPGSPVKSSGIIRFSPREEGHTHLEIALEYRPLQASMADAIRALLKSRSAPQIEAQLARAAVVVENTPTPSDTEE